MIPTDGIILSARNIGLTYRTRTGVLKWFEHKALKEVSFDLYRGENLGILGRNGSGKSSLLRILTGIISPGTGTVECGTGITRSLLTLGLGFSPDLSGRDNAVLSSMLQGMSRQDAVASLEAINEFAQLGKFFDQPVKTYSTGMRARLGFATAMTANVDILFTDEVLSVGDAHFKAKTQEVMMKKLNGDQTIVFVSHDPGQINKLCGRAVWLEKGVVQAIGETEEIIRKYKEFIERMG